jgi:hypothetical protein
MEKQYIVEVKTGNIKDAKTDADVYIQLFGERRISNEIYLDNDENNFERGKLDTFFINEDDVGWIDQIRVFHLNNGRGGPGWYVDYIKITDPSVGLSWTARIDRWLATDENDGRIDITVDIPIGAVTLEESEIRQNYLGFAYGFFVNAGNNNTTCNEPISFILKKGCSVDVSTTISESMNVELGANFFDVVDAKFSSEVAFTIATKLSTTVEETLETSINIQYPVDAGKSITIIVIFYQLWLDGTAHSSGVSMKYTDKMGFFYSTIIVDGILTPSQISDRVSQILRAAFIVKLPPVLFNHMCVPLLKKKLEVTDAVHLKKAKDSLPAPSITETQLKKFKDVHLYKHVCFPSIRTINFPYYPRRISKIYPK